MKGLFIKDLLNLKSQAKILLVMMVFYAVMGLSTGDGGMFSGILVMLCAMLPITAMSYDERAKWDKYALSMPVSRKQIVLSKYLLGIVFVGASFLLSAGFYLLTDIDDLRQVLTLCTTLTAIGIFYLAILLPLLFKVGVEKGRLLMIIALFLPVGLILLISGLNIDFGSKPEFLNEEFLVNSSWVFLVFSLVLFGVSSLVSIKIYEKKEL